MEFTAETFVARTLVSAAYSRLASTRLVSTLFGLRQVPGAERFSTLFSAVRWGVA
jgi:hypothetical protein